MVRIKDKAGMRRFMWPHFIRVALDELRQKGEVKLTGWLNLMGLEETSTIISKSEDIKFKEGNEKQGKPPTHLI